MDERFARLLEPHRKAVERYVYYKTPTREDGEDVLQDVYLLAARSMGQLRDPERFKPWLLAIAANRLKAFYRARGRLPEAAMTETAGLHPAGRGGRGVALAVRDTLDELSEADRRLLGLAYLQGMPLQEIAAALGVPVGTVKSRLHAARERFRAAYPYPPAEREGGKKMSAERKLPETLPEIVIRRTGTAAAARWEELMGFFIVPKLGERAHWAIYDYPERRRSEAYALEVTGRAAIHGVEGVEIRETETLPDGAPGTSCTVIGQMADGRCRYLAETREVDGVKRTTTFLDDDFVEGWAIGADNCGLETEMPARGLIRAVAGGYACPDAPETADVVGEYEVKVGERTFATTLIVYVERGKDGAVLCEYYTDANGRCVLDRRFNHEHWREEYYGAPWTEKLPENEVITVNGEKFVHWYSCVSDYAL